MIKYNLTCKNCDANFDSWFSSSIEYEKLKKKRYLNCIECNSFKIEKSIMAPKLINKENKDFSSQEIKKYKEFKIKINEYQKFIKSNFDYVGKNFAYEARAIHYNEKKIRKGIYGTATKKEINELKEEGIKTDIIPWIEDSSN
mgnify:FL=1